MAAQILIIEDERLVAMEMELVLADLGHEVVGIAADADSALALAQARAPDVALVDINLADGPTGVEVGRRLAQELGAAVVYITANPRMLGEGVAGAIGVLTKPTEEEAVSRAVDYALQRRRGYPVPPPPPELRLFG